MTQKRGLGRGLGALIPGAGGASAGTPPRAESEATAPTGTDAQAASASEGASLRTRSHPRTAPEPGEAGASSRPVDMFFSGDPVAPAERPAGRAASGRDVAGAMARAAAERRAGTKASGTKAAGTKASGTKAKPAGGKTAAEKPASTKATGAKASGTKMTSTKAADKAAAKSAAAVESAASPIESAVEVETVTPTPARETPPAQPAPAEPAPAQAVAAEAPVAEAPIAEAPSAEASGADDARPDLVPVPGTEFAEIPIHEIRENPRNPRTHFDEDALDELAFSVREVGVLQPVVVRPIPATDAGESFELVMGERRWRAARRAGLPAIPAIIRETSDDDLLRDALLENLHRSQLNPLEEAAAYQQLLDDFGCTQDELASRIGRSRPQISNTLRLMKLPPLVQRRLASGALSAGHARALLGLDSPALMEELAQRIVAEGLSVRAVERLVTRGLEPAAAQRTPRRSSYDPRVVDYTSRLATRLEAPVRIDVGKRKGRITLEFTNLEDLERLLDRIGIEGAEDAVGE